VLRFGANVTERTRMAALSFGRTVLDEGACQWLRLTLRDAKGTNIRVIVPRLRTVGYDVTFREFAGRHEMPADVVTEGLRWVGAV